MKQNVELLAPMTGPHGEKGTLSFANNIMIYKQTKNPDATKTFLKWWSENQNAGLDGGALWPTASADIDRQGSRTSRTTSF